MVNVPVLSEQITEVEPRVSTPSKFLTKKFFLDILLAAKLRETVRVANKPSGTFATIIPMTKITVATAFFELNPWTKPKIPPRTIAMNEIFQVIK